MLLAEINGEGCPEIEGIEDLITSAVFGHLRLVSPQMFWGDLFRRARTAYESEKSLDTVLTSKGIEMSAYHAIKAQFWRNYTGYGEPDLLLRFSEPNVPAFVLLIEVKLNSGKSSFGEDDQLAKYLRLLQDDACQSIGPSRPDLRFLIYLTRSYQAAELQESLLAAGESAFQERAFGLEWNDILYAAYDNQTANPLLGEVAAFLKRRGFAAILRIRGNTTGPVR